MVSCSDFGAPAKAMTNIGSKIRLQTCSQPIKDCIIKLNFLEYSSDSAKNRYKTRHQTRSSVTEEQTIWASAPLPSAQASGVRHNAPRSVTRFGHRSDSVPNRPTKYIGKMVPK
eukprot:5562645-Pleurochrysis_carterae.AAC.1